MQTLYIIDKNKAMLHISKGNSKLGKGIWGISMLPGNNKNMLILNNSVLLTNVTGTCSKYCDSCFNSCYAVKMGKLHHNVTIKAWAENTILLRSGKLFDKIDAFITQKNAKYLKTKQENDKVIKVFRINVSGEVESLEQFEAWNNLADKHPEVKFAVYTKNFDDLAKFLDKHGDTCNNLCINCSQWHHVADEFLSKYAGKVNVFEYDDSNNKKSTLSKEDKLRLSKITKCPAVTKEGHHAKKPNGDPITCDQCQRCYRKTGSTTAVYAH